MSGKKRCVPMPTELSTEIKFILTFMSAYYRLIRNEKVPNNLFIYASNYEFNITFYNEVGNSMSN